MTRARRIVLIAYLVLVAGCLVWVPWSYADHDSPKVQEGYDWAWSVGCEPPSAEAKGKDADGKDFVMIEASRCTGFKMGGPDLAAIALRLVALTAFGVATFLAAGKWKPTDSTHSAQQSDSPSS